MSAGAAAAQRPVPAPAEAAPTAALAFRGVTIVDVEAGTRVPDQTVVVIGNRVRRIGPARTTPVPAGARVVDARGKYLIPGLWDMHVHPFAWNGVDTLALPDLAYPLLIANGVTGIRDPGGAVSLARRRQWKREIASGVRVGPREMVAGPYFEGEGNVSPLPGIVVLRTAADAQRVVDSLHAAGADLVKAHGVSRTAFFALAAAARRRGLPFGGHLPMSAETGDTVTGLEASDSGIRFLDHFAWLVPNVCGEPLVGDMTGYQREACAAAAERLRRNNTWVVPNPFFRSGRTYFPARAFELGRRYVPGWDHASQSAGLRASPYFRRRPPTSFADWVAAHRATPGAPTADSGWAWMEAAGLPILAATDAMTDGGFGYIGFSLHEALAVMCLGGMTPLGALRTATLNPALALGAADSLGTVGVGKVADLVLLDADPLVDIWNTTKIRAVVANGRYFDRAALDGLLAEAERTARR